MGSGVSMSQLVAAAGPNTEAYRWLVVALSAGIVSAVSIVQETRTTSLLLSRWAVFLASVLIALDIVAAELVAQLLFGGQLLDDRLTEEWGKTIAYIAVAAAAPAILRGLKLSVGQTTIGPGVPYAVTRSALLDRVDDEFATRMEMKARLIAERAIERQIPPRALADFMKALVQRRGMTSTAKARIGHILGALRIGSSEDQVERLVELMYLYRMRALIRGLETGRMDPCLVRPRPVYLVKRAEGVPPVSDAPGEPSRRAPAKTVARSPLRPPAGARPDEDRQESDRSGSPGHGRRRQGS